MSFTELTLRLARILLFFYFLKKNENEKIIEWFYKKTNQI